LEPAEKNIVPFNKAVAHGHCSLWSQGGEEFLLAGHGGKGKKQIGASICASGRYNNAVAMTATVFCDLPKLLTGIQLFLVVPSSVKTARDGG
jgi:hypothetical protein